MALDPVLAADVRAWLVRAKNDLGAGRADLAAQPGYPGDAMFHAQQAAEKALKAFLTCHESPFRKTHDLRELFDSCIAIDASFGLLRDRAEGLTPYAWVFRYPGEADDPPSIDACEALDAAGDVFQAVLDRLPEETRP